MDKETFISLVDEAANRAYIYDSELFIWLLDIKQALQKGASLPITKENIALLMSLIPYQNTKQSQSQSQFKPRELSDEELTLQRQIRLDQKKSDEMWAKVYESLQDPEYIVHVVKKSIEESKEGKK